jgi:hypothetical protein
MLTSLQPAFLGIRREPRRKPGQPERDLSLWLKADVFHTHEVRNSSAKARAVMTLCVQIPHR